MSQETLRDNLLTARELVERENPLHFRMWDCLGYDNEGDLWVYPAGKEMPGWKIADLAQAHAPLEIVMPQMAMRRMDDYRRLVQTARGKRKYQGGIEVYYATKAAQAAEIVVAAASKGQLEVSSAQDLYHIEWAMSQGLIPRDMKILCNGHKPDPKDIQVPASEVDPRLVALLYLQPTDQLRHSAYVERIVNMHRQGIKVIPIIDSESELKYLQSVVQQPMEVGLRYKSYGLVKNNFDPKTLISRHGFTEDELKVAAAEIVKHPHMRLTIFHAMVGAAESIKPEEMVKALEVSFDAYCRMKKLYPSLQAFNIGGGVPPIGFGYDHAKLFDQMFAMFGRKVREYRIEPPIIQFEPGSPVAAEAGFTVMRITEEKHQNASPGQGEVPWWLPHGSFMNVAPDMWFIGKKFVILPGNYANQLTKKVVFGGTTCDSGDTCPADSHGFVRMPRVNPNILAVKDKPLVILLETQAYQEALAGGQDTAHCLEAGPAEIVLWVDKKGEIKGKFYPPRQPQAMAEMMNFAPAQVGMLREIARL